jgi:hypothetical protein
MYEGEVASTVSDPQEQLVFHMRMAYPWQTLISESYNEWIEDISNLQQRIYEIVES